MSELSRATATVTGKIGPGNTLTAVSLSNIGEFAFDVPNCLFKYRIDTDWNEIAIASAVTITITLSAAAGNYTITIANS